jgi:hypothetical protein
MTQVYLRPVAVDIPSSVEQPPQAAVASPGGSMVTHGRRRPFTPAAAAKRDAGLAIFNRERAADPEWQKGLRH